MSMLTQPTLRVPEFDLDIKSTQITAGDQLLLIWYGEIRRSGATNGTGISVNAVFLDLNSKSESALKYAQISLELVHKFTIGSEVHARATERQDTIKLVLVGYKKAEIFSYAIQENADVDSLKFYREFKTPVPNQQDGKYKYSYKSLSQTYNKVLERVFNRHQILCFKRDGKTFVMHPLTWFMAYYASTKRINRYILIKPLSSSFACTQPKTRRSRNAHAPALEDGLRLNVRTNTSNAVLLSDWMRLGDVTFLHHLKFDEYTQKHIRKIQAKFESSIQMNNQNAANAGRQERNSGFLSDIGIWHTEAVGLTFRAICVDDNTYLVTSVSSITHPYADGEPIHFEVFNKPEPTTDEDVEESSDVDVSDSSVRILSTDLQYDDAQENVAIVDGDADNPTRLWVICKTSVVGDMRKLIKDQEGDNPTNALAMIARKTRSQGSFIPEKFAVGEDKSKYANGLVGQAMLSSADKFRVADDCSVIDRHDYLFKLVKAKFAQVHYYCSVVDTGIVQNDELKYGDLRQLTCDFNGFPNRFLVLYGCLGGRWYAFVDLVPSESKPNIAGVAIYSASEALLQENIFRLLNILAHEEGVLRNPSQLLSDNAKLTKYNHIEGGDWVETAIGKLA